MKPICVKCERFYRPKRNGTSFIEGKPNHNGAPAGTVGEGQWAPYKLWMGDLWECPTCKSQIIVGIGLNPISEDYRPDFDKQIESFKAKLLVKDC